MSAYHFIGIGGIGMSALAHILLQEGCVVTGSDTKKSTLTDALEKKGARIFIGHDENNLKSGTVVYSSAIHEGNAELKKAKQLGLKRVHRSDLLNNLMQEKKVLQVTGTHGKTTTTALLSHVLVEANLDPSFAIGGQIPFRSHGVKGTGIYFVAEADESDGSFLKTPSFGAIVTNCGKDHMSYWGDERRLTEGFKIFFSNVRNQEHLFWCKDDERLCSLNPSGFSYGFSLKADLQILAFSQSLEGIVFTLLFQGRKYEKIHLSLFGKHNALNAAAVFGLALSLSVNEADIRKAFGSFQGVKRRLERRGQVHGVVCFDDYAHHPTEIETTLRAVRSLAVERRVVVLFQPHRYTRTRDFWKEFGMCFSQADRVLVTDIYDAGECPIDGITAKNLAAKIGACYVAKEDVAGKLRPFDVFVTLGAGDITDFCDPILEEYARLGFKYTLGVLSGGTSQEHEISLVSAKNMIKNLDSKFYEVKEFPISKEGFWGDSHEQKISPKILNELQQCDLVLPALHGPRGEDGMVQGFLETLGIPYIGCGYRAACLCMNKVWAKQVARENKVPVAPFIEMRKREYHKNPSQYLEQAVELLSFPIWAKPSHLGSSIGIGKANTLAEFKKNVEHAFEVDDSLIVEKHIQGREVEFAILGNEVIRIGEPCIILTGGGFYDYEKKYGPKGFDVEIPAKITEIEKQIGFELAEKVYVSAGCTGLARVDFFFDERGVFWFNEINPMPGFASMSGYPKMWEKKGMSQRDLINELVILAMRGH